MVTSASLSFIILILTSSIPIVFAAKGPVTDLTIVNSDIAPDGFKRSAVLADGKFPGPLIHGHKGDHFQIKVTDMLVDKTMERSTSIHWHGLFQHGTNYNDGAAFVTQCPIIPGDSYEYNFDVQDQAGTYWYHAHVSTQYCDGLRGPLVIYDPHDPHAHLYDVDDESTVMTIADWYHLPSPQVHPPPIANATLINGLGRYPGGPASPLAVVSVKKGKRYRFRLVSMACDSFFTFSIDGHNLTIIEADGVNTQPLVVDELVIFAAQRYSFILEAKETGGNFWIRAQQRNGTDGGPVGFAGGINLAILRYDGSPKVDPNTTQTPSVIPLVEADLRPLINPAAPGKPYPGGADINMNLVISSTPEHRFTINNASFTPPTVPTLLQILSGATTAQKLLPQGSVFTLPRNKVVELSIPSGFPHAFHLHGHVFSVIRSAGTNAYNFKNPVRRDVVSIGSSVPGSLADNVTIRFVTDNPGPWYLHCHIDWHFELGLAIVFAEDVEDIPRDDRVTPAWSGLCPDYNKFILKNSSP